MTQIFPKNKTAIENQVPFENKSLLATGIYRHYKGQSYQVLHCAKDSETNQWQVVYQCLYGDFSFWVRPLSMFTQQVTNANGEVVARFKLEIATGFTNTDLKAL